MRRDAPEGLTSTSEIGSTTRERRSTPLKGAPDSSRRLLLPLIIVAGVLLRLFVIGRESLWFDELYNVWADKLAFADMLREQVAAGHPPLYYVIAHVWYLPGTSEFWVRSLSVLAGTFTILFVYLAGRDLFSRRAGLWAAAFAAVSPLLIWYARANTFYATLIALTALSFWLLVRASLRGGWGSWAAYTAAAAAVLFCYFFGIVFVGAGWFFFLLLRRGQAAIAASLAREPGDPSGCHRGYLSDQQQLCF